MSRALTLKQKAGNIDLQVCHLGNGLLKHPLVHRFFHIVSRMGDGVFWYAIILSLPFLMASGGILYAMVMTLVGLLNVYIYKRIKKALARPRPFMAYPEITKGTQVLDEYSFPSGHTLHAVTFSMMLIACFPLAAIFLVPFAMLTAMSRVVLGVHYPSDVLVGATIGLIHGWFALTVLGWMQLV